MLPNFNGIATTKDSVLNFFHSIIYKKVFWFIFIIIVIPRWPKYHYFLSRDTKFLHNFKHLTSSKCRKIFDPNHQVNLGEGYPPTAWQVTSISLSADKWLILSKIETPVGFTEKQNTLFSLEHVLSIAYIYNIKERWWYGNYYTFQQIFSIDKKLLFKEYFLSNKAWKTNVIKLL